MGWQAPINAAALWLACTLYAGRTGISVMLANSSFAEHGADPEIVDRMLLAADAIRSSSSTSIYASLGAELRSFLEHPTGTVLPLISWDDPVFDRFEQTEPTGDQDSVIYPTATGNPPRHAGFALALRPEHRTADPDKYEAALIREIFDAVELAAALHGEPLQPAQ